MRIVSAGRVRVSADDDEPVDDSAGFAENGMVELCRRAGVDVGLIGYPVASRQLFFGAVESPYRETLALSWMLSL